MGNLSRKYRPQLFADITGQTPIIETLRREIEQQKLGHAYLFSGPRGVGKTTVARIFAKAVNCTASKSGEPCLHCEACKRIDDQQAIDIIEMDAASHTGVANVREAIIEHVRFVPAQFKYKVYIIDEAHMLSDSSWNALLKTIEEPPAHALFIFATTERHKVPATIVSRCQRFSFTRIAPDEMIGRLKMLAKEERIMVEENVLRTIAGHSEGCLRDAENLLGQLFSLGEKVITEEVAGIIIPASQMPLAAEMLTLAFARDLPAVLVKIDVLEQQGTAFLPLFDDCIAAFRQLLLAKYLTTHCERLSAGDEGEQMLVKLLSVVKPEELVNASLVLMERRREAKQGLDARFAFELGMSAIALGMCSGALPPTASIAPFQQVSKSNKTLRTIKIPSLTNAEAETLPPDTADADSPLLPANHRLQDASANNPVKPAEHTSGSESGRKTFEDVLAVWPKFLQAFETSKSLLFILKPSRPISFDGTRLTLALQYSYHLKTIQQPKHHARITEALCLLLDCPHLEVEGIIAEESVLTQTTDTHSVVHHLLDAFGGRVVS